MGLASQYVSETSREGKPEPFKCGHALLIAEFHPVRFVEAAFEGCKG